MCMCKHHCLSSSSGKPVIISPTEFSGFTTADLDVALTIIGSSPTVQVYREGVLIDNPRVKISFASTQFEMIISDLQRSDAGQYRIVATNNFGMAETNITVVPNGKSFFLLQLSLGKQDISKRGNIHMGVHDCPIM